MEHTIKVEENRKYLTHFIELSELYTRLGESYRSGSFAKVADIIHELDKSITEIEDLSEINGIGKSTLVEFEEVSSTGTSKRLESLKNKLEGKTDEPVDETSMTLVDLAKVLDLTMLEVVQLTSEYKTTSLKKLKELSEKGEIENEDISKKVMSA